MLTKLWGNCLHVAGDNMSLCNSINKQSDDMYQKL